MELFLTRREAMVLSKTYNVNNLFGMVYEEEAAEVLNNIDNEKKVIDGLIQAKKLMLEKNDKVSLTEPLKSILLCVKNPQWTVSILKELDGTTWETEKFFSLNPTEGVEIAARDEGFTFRFFESSQTWKERIKEVLFLASSDNNNGELYSIPISLKFFDQWAGYNLSNDEKSFSKMSKKAGLSYEEGKLIFETLESKSSTQIIISYEHKNKAVQVKECRMMGRQLIIISSDDAKKVTIVKQNANEVIKTLFW